ncbi:uncharacterized protein LOC107267604 isoform X2 [Cephus cinctus]|uniref:Uncharacterized protein LOC107267604 isoform X2 n=1 Tax=Cephus cinctus TaxID=211228 RepID=A0AAJ7BUZ7_CEPCN|nr:uncharacterized protein LOC107267604 isoform X2 [Cephus cinctus]
MGKWCAVPGCKTGSRTAEKRSVFRVPKDITTWKKWEQAIPGIVKLQQSDIVCEKHFNEEDIAREWVKYDANGRVIARVSYKYPQLRKLAVPTRFHDGKENCEPSQLDSSSVVDQNNGSIGAMFSFPMKSPLQEFSVYADINRVPLAVPNTGMSSSSMSVSSCDHLGDNSLLSQRATNAYSSFENREQTFNLDRDERLVADSLGRLEYSDHAYAKQMSHAQRNVIPETSTSAEMPEENAITDEDFSAYVPEEWGWAKTSTEIVQRTIFTYTILKVKNGKHCPVAQKSVTLDVNKNLQYFMYGRHIDPENTNLERILNGKEKLKDVLERFKGMNVCSGLGDMSTQFVQAGEAYEDYVDKWRCNGCSLLCKKKRCDSCINVRKCILQRTARLKNRPTLSRIGGVSNTVDRRKFQAMRMKIRRETRRRFRAQNRVKHLMSCLKAQETKLARLKDPSVDVKLSTLDISTSQKLVVKEIVAAARKKDARSRRYTDEWVMLCMLMSIRSPKDYEFLRKNNILPLPCTRTIRNYFSLINAKCGFDEGFARLLEKNLRSRNW